MRKHIKHKRIMASDAGKWMAENGHSWAAPRINEGGEKAKLSGSKHRRIRRAKVYSEKLGRWESIKDFVDAHRGHDSRDCLFVPAAQKNVPASVQFCGRSITAARYMCLLTLGTPKYDGAMVRHKCGNGHLSCVNPAHLVWGDVGDNQSDAVVHRFAGESVPDRINAIKR